MQTDQQKNLGTSNLISKSKKRKGGYSRIIENDSDSSTGDRNPKKPTRERSRSPAPARVFPVLEKTPEEGDFVLVEFLIRNKKPKYYVAKVLSKVDHEGDLEVSYMRRHNLKTGEMIFRMPPCPDLASVEMDSVKVILPQYTYDEESSSRQKGMYKFSFDFTGLYVS